MKVKVDQETCIGCALCVQTCPAVFKMNGDKAIVLVTVVPQENEELCQEAADGCPVTAILLEA